MIVWLIKSAAERYYPSTACMYMCAAIALITVKRTRR